MERVAKRPRKDGSKDVVDHRLYTLSVDRFLKTARFHDKEIAKLLGVEEKSMWYIRKKLHDHPEPCVKCEGIAKEHAELVELIETSDEGKLLREIEYLKHRNQDLESKLNKKSDGVYKEKYEGALIKLDKMKLKLELMTDMYIESKGKDVDVWA